METDYRGGLKYRKQLCMITWCYNHFVLPVVNAALSYLPSKTPYKSLEDSSNIKEYERLAREQDQKDKDVLEWRMDPRSALYDYAAINARLARLQKLGSNDDIGSLMFFLRAGMIRNLAGINNKRLYRKARWGTKCLIEEYVQETIRQMELVAHSKSIPKPQLKEFFLDLKKSYGTTALVLHGGTSFGLCHLGVIKALLEIYSLPRVICGSFIGSVIAAIVCTKNDAELRDELFRKKNMIDISAFTNKGDSVIASTLRKLMRFVKSGKFFDVMILEKCIQDNIGNMTFREAFQRSNRALNIVIRDKDNMILLNYMNAPEVVIWSAACASCAIPGVYEEVKIVAKMDDGSLIPWIPGGSFKLGSATIEKGDLRSQLAELYGVNNMIVSHVPSFCSFRPTLASDEGYRGFSKAIYKWLISEVAHRYVQCKYFGLVPKFLTKWEQCIVRPQLGDVNVVPHLYFSEAFLLMKNPDAKFIDYCIKKGERFAWKRLREIQMRCSIEFALDSILHRQRKKKLI